jgi:nitrite reductase/ring-hydroxylating ferredoxin subunit
MTTGTARALPLIEECASGRVVEPFPRGWYFVAFADELRPGQVKSVELFGRDWALFRTVTGRASLLASQCCHLGADLGRTGKVVGENLRCALHGWQFDTGGTCVVAPRVEKIPRKARQRRLEVVERLGIVWCWWGSEEPAPFTDLAGLDGAAYVNLKGEIYEGVGDPRTIMEHAADFYHLEFHHIRRRKHYLHLVADEGAKLEYEVTYDVPAWVRELGVQLKGFNEFIAPCASIYRVNLASRAPRDRALAAMVLGVTPVREGKTLLAWRMVGRKPIARAPFGLVDAAAVRAIYGFFRRNVYQDLEILKTIRRLEKPLWVEPDGPSVRAYRAFYDRACAPLGTG